MDKNWLQDYQSKEDAKYEKFAASVESGKGILGSTYPFEKRLDSKGPVGYLHFDSVWAQIPLFEKSIFPLVPRPLDQVSEICGFKDTSDFNGLIDLAKIGRIQFILTSSAVDYAGLDYLNPIFEELKAPAPMEIPATVFAPESQLKEYATEYYTMAEFKWIPRLQAIYSGFPENYVQKRIVDYLSTYGFLRITGYNDVANLLLNLMIDDVEKAQYFFSIFGNLVTNAIANPAYAIHHSIGCYSNEMLNEGLAEVGKVYDLKRLAAIKKTALPYEIGRFLMKKLTFLPESYQACLALMDKYKQEDVYDLMRAISEGSAKNDFAGVQTTDDELSESFDSMWKDARRIAKMSKGINYAATVGLGAVGTVTSSSAGVGGILAGLGFQVLDKSFGAVPLSERIAKMLSPNHLVAMFDFKRKYSIPDV